MWVFGYGSLIWNPGFSYEESRVGYIRGYVRRFWQGNDHHRGRPDKPGRVATLVEDKEGITWGRAFLMGEDNESSLTYLDKRENKLGGYSTTIVTFHPRDPREDPIPVLLYMALPTNHLYLGPAPLPDLATEISECSGICGHNAEYVLRLADFMREQAPDIWDEHLYHLEHLVKARLKAKNLSIDDVMILYSQFSQLQLEEKSSSGISSGDSDDNSYESRNKKRNSNPRRSSQDFTSMVPTRKLRCVDI